MNTREYLNFIYLIFGDPFKIVFCGNFLSIFYSSYIRYNNKIIIITIRIN